jgi:diphthamide biosynthesis methyltransferase
MTHTEILKAAHRQARRMEYVGGPSYAERLSVAMREMYAFARKTRPSLAYRPNTARDAMGVALGAH